MSRTTSGSSPSTPPASARPPRTASVGRPCPASSRTRPRRPPRDSPRCPETASSHCVGRVARRQEVPHHRLHRHRRPGGHLHREAAHLRDPWTDERGPVLLHGQRREREHRGARVARRLGGPARLQRGDGRSRHHLHARGAHLPRPHLHQRCDLHDHVGGGAVQRPRRRWGRRKRRGTRRNGRRRRRRRHHQRSTHDAARGRAERGRRCGRSARRPRRSVGPRQRRYRAPGAAGAPALAEFSPTATSGITGKRTTYGGTGTPTSGPGIDGRGTGAGGPAANRGGNGVVIVSYEIAP